MRQLHDLSPPAGLRIARQMGLPVPRRIIVVAVQLSGAEPSRRVSPLVAAAVPRTFRAIAI